MAPKLFFTVAWGRYPAGLLSALNTHGADGPQSRPCRQRCRQQEAESALEEAAESKPVPPRRQTRAYPARRHLREAWGPEAPALWSGSPHNSTAQVGAVPGA